MHRDPRDAHREEKKQTHEDTERRQLCASQGERASGETNPASILNF